ncbi:aminoglycoside adenylyltransferase domain-containing protein [Legionella sainthelensi]|uniref:Aminoglycoside (3'') (9) adenylyltransferase n=1 Tax=Legionella sainthelensi TaxID=28087 RepID=A0A2H5FGE3_9GAMM|nr:aminoglycoside adenylyltransferase domain-containing protein [Legionella sainthelensi]AUH70620.1 DUF4111 domain-containing protein [Legionella sainthelensi]
MNKNIKEKINTLWVNSEVTALLQEFLYQLRSILLEKFIGLYVGGSIANSSFNPNTSDIDCYIVTSAHLCENTITQIEIMHNQLYSSQLPYAKKVEASYISQIELWDFNPEKSRPYFNEGKLYQAPYNSNFIIELFMLRNKGFAISGPPIKNLIQEISTQDLQLAIKRNLYDYWQVMLFDLVKLSRSDYQVFAILTMCRTLYSIEKGDIASKIGAAKWVIDKYNIWEDLITKALAWEPDLELNKLNETQQFIKYVLDKNL